MNLTLPRLGFVAALAALPLFAKADIVVEQTNLSGSMQIEYFEPIGQSFTAASDTLLGFDFYIVPINSYLNSPTPITLSIVDGAGTGGTVLASQVLNLSGGFSGWAGATFNLNLIMGGVYTATLDTTTAYWGVAGSEPNLYAGGQLFSEPDSGIFTDLVFRATFAEPSVPDLGNTLGLLVAGLAGLMGAHRRLRRNA